VDQAISSEAMMTGVKDGQIENLNSVQHDRTWPRWSRIIVSENAQLLYPRQASKLVRRRKAGVVHCTKMA